MLVSIVIPVYNEFLTLPQVLARVRAAPLPEGCEREILVVDDGSTDGTHALLAAAAADGVRTIASEAPGPRGKGAAIRTALAHARGAIVLIQDGDLEYDPADHARLIVPLLRHEADVVFGSRFLTGRSRRELGMTRSAWLANKLLARTANALYRAAITDEATAYKAFRADLLRGLDLHCQKFEFCPEVTAKLCRRGIPIHEVPIAYNARSRAQGKKITARDGLAALFTLLRYRRWC
ncbi:MAG: glycosyltransferase family 2 protein [Terriglobales bacterium]